MWFRNLLVYRLDKDAGLDADALDGDLARNALQPCGSYEMESRGWIAPRAAGRHLHAVERQWLIALGINQKLLPASVINQTVKERAEALAATQDHPVGRKQMRDIRERALAELMPKALSRRHTTRAWIDPVNHRLVVDSAAEKKADDLLGELRKAQPGFSAKRLDTAHSPGAAMTKWLSDGEPPRGFTIDQDLELRAADESKGTIRYQHLNLEGREIRGHLSAGMTVARLGLTWRDRISFVLTNQFQVKRVIFLDLAREDTQGKGQDADEQFDIDFALMAGEFAHLITDLAKALGGENKRGE